MGYLKLYDVKNPFVDARGNVLKSGDAVMYASLWSGVMLGTLRVGEIGENRYSYMVETSTHSYGISSTCDYIIKLEDNWEQNYNVLVSRLMSESGYSEVTFQYQPIKSIENCSSQMYKSNTGKNDIRSLSMIDYLGNSVNAGDLVLYISNERDNGSKRMREMLRYGIVISDTQVLNENLEKKSIHFVLKLMNLVDYEIRLQKTLYSQYTKSSVKDVSLSVGDVYKDDAGYMYFYIDKVNFLYTYGDDSNTMITWQPKKKIGNWFKVPLSTLVLTDMLNGEFSSFVDILKVQLIKTGKVVEKHFTIKGNLYATCKNIYDIDILTTELPKKHVYCGHAVVSFNSISVNFEKETKNLWSSLKLRFEVNS